jgi:hypothetical protein
MAYTPIFSPLQTKYGTHYSDGLRAGPLFRYQLSVPASPRDFTNKSVGAPGVPVSPVYNYYVKPKAPTADALSAANTLAAAGYATLVAAPNTNVTGVSLVTTAAGEIVYTLDVPRTLTITGAAGVTATNVTIYAYDEYGFPFVEDLAGPVGATTVTSKKAVSALRAVYFSAGTTANVSIGTSNVFGLPYRVPDASHVLKLTFNNIDYMFGTTNVPAATVYTLTNAAITAPVGAAFTYSDLTDPATAATGDVRGTFCPGTAAGFLADGNRALLVSIYESGQDPIYIARFGLNSDLLQSKATIGNLQFNRAFV